jgi:hypothetical protein
MLQDLDQCGGLSVKDVDSAVVAPSNHDSTHLTESNLLGKLPHCIPSGESSLPSSSVELMGVKAMQYIVNHNFISRAIDGS